MATNMAALRRRLREVEERLRERDAARARQAAEAELAARNAGTAEVRRRRELTPEQREQENAQRREDNRVARERFLAEDERARAERERARAEQERARAAEEAAPVLRRAAGLWTPEARLALNRELQAGQAVNVHIQAAKLNKKVPMIVKVIKKDIPRNDYSDFLSYLDTRLKTYLETSPDFKQKSVNSEYNPGENANGKKKYKPRVLKREDWLNDYNKIRGEIVSSAPYILEEQKERLGSIIDFVFKHDLQECFTTGFIYDNAHAYNYNRSHPSRASCFGGILERTVSTFVNCIKGMKGGPFTELSAILEETPLSWADLDKSTKAEWIREWNDFLTKWARENLKNRRIKSMMPTKRSETFIEEFTDTKSPPAYVIQHLKTEFFKGLDALWEDYGYNAEGAEDAEEGFDYGAYGGGGGGGRARKTRRAKAAKKYSRRKRGSRIR